MDSTNAPAPSSADRSASANSKPLVKLTRREKNRAYKAAQRNRQKAAGITTIQIELSSEEAQAFRAMQRIQSGPEWDFAKRALLTGAKFVANSGNSRGGKKKIRRLADASELFNGAACSDEAGEGNRGTDRENTANTENP